MQTMTARQKEWMVYAAVALIVGGGFLVTALYRDYRARSLIAARLHSPAAEYHARLAALHGAGAAEPNGGSADAYAANQDRALQADLAGIREAEHVFARYEAEVDEEHLAWLERDLFARPVWTWSVEETDRVNRFLAGHADLLEAVRALARAGGPVCVLNLSRGFDTPLPHLVPLSRTGQLLAANAMALARAGETEAAAEDLLACLRLADRLKEDPLRFAQLARGSMYTDYLTRLTRAFAPGEVPPAFAAALAENLRGQDLAASWMAVWQAESGFAVAPRDPAGGDATTRRRNNIRRRRQAWPEPEWLRGTPLAGMVVRQEQVQFLDRCDELEGLLRVPYFELASQEEVPEGTPRPVNRYSRLDIRAFHVPMTRLATLQKVALWGIAVEAWEREHGHYPAQIEEATIGAHDISTEDPFSGRPLCYRPDETGFVLYSVGENGRDDGGRARGPAADIVWRG